MKKPVAQMTEREMLEELITEKRRNDIVKIVFLGIFLAVSVIVIILLAVYLPPVIAFFRRLSESVQQVQEELQRVLNAADSVRETLSGIGSAGKDTLENAAAQLNELLERIAGFFR